MQKKQNKNWNKSVAGLKFQQHFYFSSAKKQIRTTYLLRSSSDLFCLVTRTGIEPMFSAWEANVLTAWPTSHCFRAWLLYTKGFCLSIGFLKKIKIFFVGFCRAIFVAFWVAAGCPLSFRWCPYAGLPHGFVCGWCWLDSLGRGGAGIFILHGGYLHKGKGTPSSLQPHQSGYHAHAKVKAEAFASASL